MSDASSTLALTPTLIPTFVVCVNPNPDLNSAPSSRCCLPQGSATHIASSKLFPMYYASSTATIHLTLTVLTPALRRTASSHAGGLNSEYTEMLQTLNVTDSAIEPADIARWSQEHPGTSAGLTPVDPVFSTPLGKLMPALPPLMYSADPGLTQLGLGLEGGDYFLRLHTPFSIPRLMQRVRHPGDCQVTSAATECDSTVMMLERWRLYAIPIIRQSGLPFRITDSDCLVVVESPIAGLGSGTTC